MLEGYFDDSGTHGGARVVLWGGVIGTAESFAELDTKWRALLADPMDGLKPPLKEFSLHDCRAREGEFLRYNEAESNLAQRRFRQIIIDSGVGSFACGVDVEEWDRQVTGDLRLMMGHAERAAIGICARTAAEWFELEDEAMSVRFDEGRAHYVTGLLPGVRGLFPQLDKIIEFGFGVVEYFPGLQAADTVANESYRYLLKWLDDNRAHASAHFTHLLDEAFSVQVTFMGRDQIADLVTNMQRSLDKLIELGSQSDFT